MLKVEIHFKRQIGEQWSKWFDGDHQPSHIVPAIARE